MELSASSVGDALASATQRAQVPHSTIYVSPSVREGSTFNHALSEFLSPPHKELIQRAERMGGAAVPAMGVWVDGAEEAAVVDAPSHLSKRLGAALALKHKQKAYAHFDATGQGGEQHILEFDQPVPLDDLYKTLIHSGVDFGTFIPTAQDPTKIEALHVLTGENDNTGEKLRALFRSKARHIVNRGGVDFPGAATREDAAKLFRQILQRAD